MSAEPGFNKLLTKENYHKYIKLSGISDHCLYHAENIQRKIHEVKMNATNNDEFCVKVLNNKDVLFKKTVASGLPIMLEVLSFDEIFEDYLKKHLENEHEAFELDELETCREYSNICLNFLLKSCNTCRHAITTLLESDNAFTYETNTVFAKFSNKEKFEGARSPTASVFIVKSPFSESSDFKHLLIYEEDLSKYTILRPLSAKVDIEIALELHKILTQFGAPQKITIYGYGQKFIKEVIEKSKDMSREFDIVYDFKPTVYEKSAEVFGRIEQWCFKTGIQYWELGAPYAQKVMNAETSLDSNGDTLPSPHDLFFGKIDDCFSQDFATESYRMQLAKYVNMSE